MPMNSTSKGIFLFLNNGMKGRVMSSRLCLVRVKAFLKNIPFSKENVFMCLVVFQKIFRKIFSGVWKMLQGKIQNQKNKHSTQIDARRSTGFDSVVLRELQSNDRAVDRDLAKHRAASQDRDLAKRRLRSRKAPRRSRSAQRRVRDLAKCQSQSARRRDHDLAKHRANRYWREGEFAISDRNRRRWCLRTAPTGAWCVQTAQTGYASPSRSLSLSLRNSFEVKIGTEIHFRSQSLFFWVNENQFLENSIFRTNQTPAFPKKHFRKWFSPKTNTAQDSEDA